MNKPLTLAQAQNICSAYQFLEGASYDKDFPTTTPIQAVLVAPYREMEQENFVDDFDQLGDADLMAYNPKDGYDVIVLARYKPDNEICVWMDLRTFVKKNMAEVAKYHKRYVISSSGNEVAA
jgi:hypothetical protein